jgi:hypothetical protein
MRKLALIFAFILLSISFLFSAPIDTATAKRVAVNFWKQNNVVGMKNGQTLRIQREVPDFIYEPLDTSFTGLYVFKSTDNNGYVIVSAETSVIPILGYSNDATFDASNMPPALRNWLWGYELEIRGARQERYVVSEEIQREWEILLAGQNLTVRNTTNVAPLLTTNWGQGWPYNLLCPYDYDANTYTVTGCVATAMAQVMKYWEYPQIGNGSHTYTHLTYGTMSANFEAEMMFNWNEMLNNYSTSSSYTAIQVTAISTLMKMCGVSVDMNYGIESQGGSSAITTTAAVLETEPLAQTYPSAENALKTYFDYSSNLIGIANSNYSNNQWISILKNELDNNRVILYSGSGSGGGHAFVCDGYNNNYFHFNWGWNGGSNGYFSVTSLTPSSYNFSQTQQAVIGITPANQTTHPNYDLMMYSSLTTSASSYQFHNDVTLTGTIANMGNTTFNGYIHAIISDNNGNVVKEIYTYASIPANQHVTKTFTISGGLPLAPGEYLACLTSSTNPNDITSAQLIRDNPSHVNLVMFSVEYETTIETYSEFDYWSGTENIYPGQTLTVNVDVLNAGSTTFSGNVAIALLDADETLVQFVEQKNLISSSALPANHHFTDGLNFSGTITASPGEYFLALLWKEFSSASWYYAGSGHNYLNPVRITISPQPVADIYEANNTAATAYELTPIFNNDIAEINTNGANFHTQSDEDYYKINLPSGFAYSAIPVLEDMYYNNDISYSVDAKLYYAVNNTSSWIGPIDLDASILYYEQYEVPLNDGGTIYYKVVPSYTGDLGTYRLNLLIGRQILHDQYEENDNSTSAYLLGSVTSSNATFDANANFHITTDNDYYKINLPAGYSYTINANILNSYNNTSYTADAKFATSEDGNTFSNNYGNSMPALTMSNGGTLYFRVLPYTDNEIGTYSLHISVTRAGGIEPDMYEPNNIVSAAYLLSSVTSSSATIDATANFHITTDNDYYKINLPSGYSYTINANITDSYDDNNYTADAKFATSENGNTWSSNYGVYMPALTMSNGGTLYFRVLPYTDHEIGTYSLHISVTRTGGIEPDMYEPNNSVTTSYVLSTVEGNSTVINAEANFHTPNDVDYYKIFLNPGHSYEVNARLFDHHNDNSHSVDAKVSFSMDGNNWSADEDDMTQSVSYSNGGRIYYRVSPNQSGTVGTYRLKVTISASNDVSNYENIPIDIYPNPVSKNLYVTIPESVTINHIEIFNMAGQMVKKTTLNDKMLEVSNLSKGMYIIRIYTNGAIITEKFVKM